jgi:hypothetical protein
VTVEDATAQAWGEFYAINGRSGYTSPTEAAEGRAAMARVFHDAAPPPIGPDWSKLLPDVPPPPPVLSPAEAYLAGLQASIDDARAEIDRAAQLAVVGAFTEAHRIATRAREIIAFAERRLAEPEAEREARELRNAKARAVRAAKRAAAEADHA